MGKVKWRHTLALTKVRARETWTHYRAARWMFWWLMLAALVRSIGTPTTKINTVAYVLPTYLDWMLFAGIAFAATETLFYKENERLMAALPQTRATRFLSYVLLIVGNGLAVIGIGLVLYLATYAGAATLGRSIFGWNMAYSFDLRLVLASGLVAAGLMLAACAVLAGLAWVQERFGKAFYVAAAAVVVLYVGYDIFWPIVAFEEEPAQGSVYVHESDPENREPIERTIEKYYQQTGGEGWVTATFPVPEGATEIVSDVLFRAAARESADCPPGMLQVVYEAPLRELYGVDLRQFYEYELRLVQDEGSWVLDFTWIVDGQPVEERDEKLQMCFLSPCGQWMNWFWPTDDTYARYDVRIGDRVDYTQGTAIVYYAPGEAVVVH